MSRFTVKKILPSRDRIEKPFGMVKEKYVNFQKMQLRLIREVSSYPHFKRHYLPCVLSRQPTLLGAIWSRRVERKRGERGEGACMGGAGWGWGGDVSAPLLE